MSTFLSHLDFYGTHFTFTLNKKRKFTTSFGGILTIITGILLVVLFVILGDEMINRKNPKTSISQYLTKQHPQINLSDYNIDIGIKIAQAEGNTENLINFTGDYLYSEVLYKTDYIDNETQIQKMENKSNMRNCSNENFLQTVDKPESYSCFNLNESFGGTLGKSINSSMLGLYIANCKYNAPYGSPFIKCNSVTNLTNTFKKHNTNPYMLIVQYPKFYYDPWNKEHPVTIEYQTLSFPFDHNLQRIDKLYFHKSITNEDNGWWFEQPSNQSYWTIESMTHFYNYKANEDLQIRYSSSILYTLSFEMSFDTTSYSRSYMKFQEVLAIVTSMLKIIAIAFEVFSFFINSSFLKLFLMRLFFDLGSSSTGALGVGTISLKSIPDKSNISLNVTKTNLLNQAKTATTTTNAFKNNYTKELNTEQLSKIHLNSGKPLKKMKYSYCFALRRSLYLMFPSEKAKAKVYDFGYKLIRKEIELSKYVKMLFDMMIIKKALFSKEQIEHILGAKKPNLFNRQEIDELYALNMTTKINGNVTQILDMCSTVYCNNNRMSSTYQTPKRPPPLGKFGQKFGSWENINGTNK